ncbi:Dna-directed rna polymerase subunit beta [Thalictrum thalictroides]|uniref:Dna-directed rna polymerase subunit beta n=1 Tax=Thalictrum thalictroides TaxID=46969 RepID=A0A7J6WSC4_THATH|nr:Dna-directed rna polymerase subunit beta [Thalictrum thalictroides]
MIIAYKSFFSSITITIPSPYLVISRNGRRLKTTQAQKQDPTEKLETQKQPILSLRVPSVFLARSAVAVLGLGFIDAGYSGDWSRIGVISRETEEFLKVAAYVTISLIFWPCGIGFQLIPRRKL